METPFVLPLLPKEELSETDLAINYIINLYNGGDCDGPPGIKMQVRRHFISVAKCKKFPLNILTFSFVVIDLY